MTYKTFVSGQVLQASEVNTYLMKQAVMTFASAADRTTALSGAGILVEGMTSYLLDENSLEVYNGSAWVQITDEAAYVATTQSTTLTTYTDLATVGPSITIRTGTKALIHIGSLITPPASNNAAISIAVSGATTIAAADSKAIVTPTNSRFGSVFYFDTLTAGVNTFTMKYKTVGAGTSNFGDRYIAGKGLL